MKKLISSGGYIPKWLPCGKKVNRNGRTGQGCITECPYKTVDEIESCYKEYKNRLILSASMLGMYKPGMWFTDLKDEYFDYLEKLEQTPTSNTK